MTQKEVGLPILLIVSLKVPSERIPNDVASNRLEVVGVDFTAFHPTDELAGQTRDPTQTPFQGSTGRYGHTHKRGESIVEF